MTKLDYGESEKFNKNNKNAYLWAHVFLWTKQRVGEIGLRLWGKYNLSKLLSCSLASFVFKICSTARKVSLSSTSIMANSSQNSLGEPALCSSSSHWEESPERVNSELDDTSPEGFTPAPSFSSVNMCISTSSMTSEEALCYDPQSFAGHFGNEDANIDTYYSKVSPPTRVILFYLPFLTALSFRDCNRRP